MPLATTSDLTALRERALDAGRAAGLHAVGVTGADAFPEVAEVLVERRDRGLAGGMQFTYRNPARSTDPRATLPSARSVIAGARGYGGPLPDRPEHGVHGRVARYACGDHYQRLDDGLEAVAEALRADGWRAVVVADQNHLVDRAVAHRAGLGFYGKSSLLLLPGEGSWFVLGAVLTDAPLAPTAAEPVGDGCGPCRRCLVECPTGAIVEPGVVDARRCLAWLVQAPGEIPREHRVGLGDRIYGCDECQDACPPNRVQLRHHRTGAVLDPAPGDAAGPDRAWIDLLDLLAADDATLLDRHGRWYLAARDPRWLRRNALVALGNVGDARDPGVTGALERTVRADDDLLAAHAAWALRRLGRTDLVAAAIAAGIELGPLTRAELDAPAPPVAPGAAR